jgi:hypothetical protein
MREMDKLLGLEKRKKEKGYNKKKTSNYVHTGTLFTAP